MRASPDRVFAHLGRVDHLPRYGAPLWMTAESTEKRRTGQVVTLTGYLIGLPIESVQRVVLRPPHAIEFKQLRGTLRALSGECTLRAVEDGTEVRYRLEVDPAIAMISDDAARQFLVQFAERFLDRIKLAAERKAPLGRGARGVASETAAVEEEEAEPAPDTAAAAVPADRAAPAPRADSLPGPDAAQAVAPEARPGTRRDTAPRSAAGTPQAAPSQPIGRRRRRRHRRRGRRPGNPGTTASGSPPA